MQAALVICFYFQSVEVALADDIAAVDYGASTIVAKPGSTEEQGDGTDVSVASKYRVVSSQVLANGIAVGKRMPSTKVLNQSDARPWHFQELLPSNGRWRIVIFTGDVTQERQREKLEKIGRKLGSRGPDSLLRRFTPPNARHDAVIELLAVHSAPRTAVTIFDFPEVFRPYDDVEGWDYNKIFADDRSYHEGHGKIYETFQISAEGCAVILRPDQYVSYVGPMEDVEALDKFFSAFMIPVTTAKSDGAALDADSNPKTVVTSATSSGAGSNGNSNVKTVLMDQLVM